MAESRAAYVAGQWRTTRDQQPIHAPYDGRHVSTVSLCGPAELEEAIAAAHAAAPAARRLATWERVEICRHAGRWFAEHKQPVAETMCAEGGKPIGDALAEVDRAVHCFEAAAEEAGRLGGELMPLDLRPSAPGRFGITKRVPVGPIAAISPFNFPLNLAVHKLAPAIAAGCPVVLKPAPQTPTSCLQLAEALQGSAWPKGAFSVVPSVPEVADVLVTDDRLKLLTFTGSPKVGWALKARAGKKKVLLELGSNAAVVVDEGADLDWAVPRIVYGAFSYAGQKCISVQRIYAHQSIYQDLVARLVAETQKAKLGDPLDPAVLVGPLINEAAALRVEAWIAEAQARGAKLLLGGARQGNLVPPTILTGVPRDSKVSCEEVFGPVVVVEPYRDFQEALDRVNDSTFGLQAGVFTEHLDRALLAFDELEVGGVILNDIPTWRIDPMPYGGVKDSGLGREGLRWAVEEMTELRLLVVNRAHHVR